MADAFFWTTYVALWAPVLILIVAVFALYRYYGSVLVNSREGRMSQGPEVGRQLAHITFRDTRNEVVDLTTQGTRPILVFMAQIACKPCREALPALANFATKYQDAVDVVFVCAGKLDEVQQFARSLPRTVRIIADPRRAGFVTLRVSSTPFAFILDNERIVRGTGMPVVTKAFEWFVRQLDDPRTEQVNSDFASLDIIRTHA